MGFTKEELKKFRKEKEAKEKLDRETNAKRAEIEKRFKDGGFKDLKPLWHTNLTDIDLSLQREKIEEKKIKNGFSIILGVDFEFLLNTLQGGNSDLFREKIMYNEELNDYRISDILDFWSREIALIPPTITDNDFGNINSHFLFPTDGKHRMNVSYFYGVKTIPILVFNDQLDKIKSILDNKYESIVSNEK